MVTGYMFKKASNCPIALPSKFVRKWLTSCWKTGNHIVRTESRWPFAPTKLCLRASISSEIDLKIQSSSHMVLRPSTWEKSLNKSFCTYCTSLCCTLTISKRFSLRSGIFPKEVGRTHNFKGLKYKGMLFIRQQDMIFHLHWVKNCSRIVTLGQTSVTDKWVSCNSFEAHAWMLLHMFISYCYLFSLQPVFVPSIQFKARLNKLKKLNHPSINAAES